MVNRFYVGDIFHAKTITKEAYIEKNVLYKEDDNNYLDLINDVSYTTDSSKKSYVIEDSLLLMNPNDFKEDYNYLLSRCNDIKKTKKKHWYNVIHR